MQHQTILSQNVKEIRKSNNVQNLYISKKELVKITNVHLKKEISDAKIPTHKVNRAKNYSKNVLKE